MKRIHLFFMLVGLFSIALPLGGVNSSALSDDPVRVISLSPVGDEKAFTVAFSQDGNQLIVGASAGMYLFNTKTFSQNHFISTGTWVRNLAISPDGSTLAAGLFDNTAGLWRLSDLQKLHSFEGHESWVRSVAFTPDGKFLATTADDDTIRLWNIENGSLQLKIENLKGVRTLAVSPDGETLAVGLQDNTIQLRSLSEGSLLRTLTGHEGWVRCLAFSPDGQKLASGAFDATARIWDVATGRLVYTLAEHQSSVLGIAFSPDGLSLATGSVDKTVRLWKVIDGSPIRVLVGHEGFVYSVAFSPDGTMLASGAADNTVRLWDLTKASKKPAKLPYTPHDCRVCHHPMASTKPPAVVEVRCELCHSGGAGLNWCPNFLRSPNTVLGYDAHPKASIRNSGVPVGAESLAVTIFSPANGETLYSQKGYVAPVAVSGKVESLIQPLEDVELHLEIWAGSKMISNLTTSPTATGYFKFLLGVNPSGNMLRINDPAAPLSCANCHDDFIVQAYLPSGDIQLIVKATTKDGLQARDERWVQADISSNKKIEVAVNDSSSGEAVEGLTIQAFTRLYLWRGRVTNAVMDGQGLASMNVEALSQAATVYEIRIPNQVVDGVFYSSQQTRTVVIEPGAANPPQIAIKVNAQRGLINGKLLNGQNPFAGSVPVWAFRLPAGPGYQTETTGDGLFSFKDLPVSKYLVFPDNKTLDSYSLAGNPRLVDLTQSPMGDVEIKASRQNGSSISGVFGESTGGWLPFAWLVAPEGAAHPGDLKSGVWLMNDLLVDGKNWVASAPGYYSQEIKLSKDNPGLAIHLERRPDLKIMKWGAGEILIPGETQAIISENNVKLENGWLWGTTQVGQPLVIEATGTEITISAGQFALEQLPGKVAWFYLFNGQAQLRSQKTGQILTLQGGEMAALLDDRPLAALPYQQELAPAFQPAGEAPISPVWKPGLAEQFWSTLEGLGITAAQLVTFITYVVAFSSLVITPWFTLKWWLKYRKNLGEENE